MSLTFIVGHLTRQRVDAIANDGLVAATVAVAARSLNEGLDEIRRGFLHEATHDLAASV